MSFLAMTGAQPLRAAARMIADRREVSVKMRKPDDAV
jgi:hypothetical protein